ncbi:unnamed protein product [marine sediment metagenome]|uniref:Uncharacterized protein n=1 Tax=marine sediment metagenome TaxID=412755 RepID=X1L659_9ZZZZ
MNKNDKEKKRTITEKNIKGKVQLLKVQITEYENMRNLLQAKLTDTNNAIIVLSGKMVAYAELLQELTNKSVAPKKT